MKTLRWRIVVAALGLFGWEAISPSATPWTYVGVYELGLVTALLLTYLGPGKGARWLG